MPMARDFFTMDDFDLSDRTVLLRVDINSPIDPATGELLNDARIREHLLTIRELRGAKVALLAHQSRPGRDDFTTLEVHAERFAALLGRPVRYVPSLFGRPAIELLGGVKADDSIAVASHMLEKDLVDSVLTSGGVANLFLDAAGIDPGKPTTDFMRREVEDYDAHLAMCKELLARFPGRIFRPTDVVLNDEGVRRPVPVSALPTKWPVYDIGLDTIARYVEEIHRAKTIFFNGPAGVFELEPFSVGTREVPTAVAEADGFSLVRGGHTVAAVEQLGLSDPIDHVSTGRGALINFLAGKELPLVNALKHSYKKFAQTKK